LELLQIAKQAISCPRLSSKTTCSFTAYMSGKENTKTSFITKQPLNGAAQSKDWLQHLAFPCWPHSVKMFPLVH
jgi:hypothetical protein